MIRDIKFLLVGLAIFVVIIYMYLLNKTRSEKTATSTLTFQVELPSRSGVTVPL